jgi:IgGFc binding protein
MRRTSLSILLVSIGWIGCSSGRPGLSDGPFAPFAGIDGGNDAGCTGMSCSRDLRSVHDCHGNIVTECAMDQACGDGRCLPACEAAAVNEGSVGCTFAVPGPINPPVIRGSCYAFFVANNWTSPATLRFSYEGTERSLDGAVWVPVVENGLVTHTKLDGPVPPGGGAVIFVSEEDTGASQRVACPVGVKPILTKEPAIYGTGFGRAMSLTSDAPVSMYSMYPYGGASSYFPSATLLFPSTSFRNNYVLASAWGGKNDSWGRGELPNHSPDVPKSGMPTIQILAVEDETSIELLPRVDILGGNGVPATLRGHVASYTLQRGEIMQLTQDHELVGSVLQANKPVGVFGGHTALFVPGDVKAEDCQNNQITPVSAWGSEYAVLPAPRRSALVSQGRTDERDRSIVRLVGAANGTTLMYEPMRPPGAPTTLETGELARFYFDEPFVVRSQDAAHPFYVTVLMTGANASSNRIGDPEVAMVVPTDQWLDTYGFFSDYSYEFSSIFLTRRKEGGSFRDVTLDCAGVVDGWKPISADYEWTFVELTRSRKGQTYPGGTCSDGAHRIQSEAPFTMTVWGLAAYASYAYPGGTGLRPISDVNVPIR